MRRLLTKNVDKKKIRRLCDFINGYLRLEKPENKLNFEKIADILGLLQTEISTIFRELDDEKR